MKSRIDRRFLFVMPAIAGCLAVVSTAGAVPVVIPTNAGGADVELRPRDQNVDAFGLLGGVANQAHGTNRGNNSEIATRVNDAFDAGVDPTLGVNEFISHFFRNVSGGNSDDNSLFYVKFDLTNIPASLRDNPGHSFWTDWGRVNFRLHVRNAAGNFLVRGTHPDPMNDEEQELRLRVRALNPTGTYLEDDANAANRVDQVGNAYISNFYRYNWDEGTGNVDGAPTGITFYNAPGMKPHCAVSGACFDQDVLDALNLDPVDYPFTDPGHADYPTLVSQLNTTLQQRQGMFDGLFDDNVVDLGVITPADVHDPDLHSSSLQIGQAIDFESSALKQLVRDALDAGREHVTLIVHNDHDPTAYQPDLGRLGTTSSNFLNRNHLLVPKECFEGNCGGTDGAFFGPNDVTGAFSPKLMLIPEPSSMMLVGLGMLIVALVRRRA